MLRAQRQELVQRELLLDTMVQNTPVAMLLSAEGGDGLRRVVYANLASRRLLNDGRKLEGQRMDELVQALPVELGEALARGSDSLFAVPGEDDGEEEVYHLSRRYFSLNGRRHELLLIRLLTPELRRQEVQTWKKVIRVISHELNNSLAPIASLAHSGAELVRRGRTERLVEVFSTIEDRARHLEGFIRGYARFAKLPQPQLQAVAWSDFLARLQRQIGFELEGASADLRARVDGTSSFPTTKTRSRRAAARMAATMYATGCTTPTWISTVRKCPNPSAISARYATCCKAIAARCCVSRYCRRTIVHR